jgi:hypothetical protein
VLRHERRGEVGHKKLEVYLSAENIFTNVSCEMNWADFVSTLTSPTVMELDHDRCRRLNRSRVWVDVPLVRHQGDHSPTLIARENDVIFDAFSEILLEDGIDMAQHDHKSRESSRRAHSANRAIEGYQRTNTNLFYWIQSSCCRRRVPSSTGVQVDQRGYNNSDDRLQTNVAGIHAIGDAVIYPQLL